MRAAPRFSAAVSTIAVSVSIATACIVESAVYNFSVANVSDHTGYVRVTTSKTAWFTVHGQTHGGLAGEFGEVEPGWTIDVFDEGCVLLGSFPMAFQRGSVWIGEGDARIQEGDGWALGGQETFEPASLTATSPCVNQVDPTSRP
jgi:hypothetical protein